ncbi:response regulator [Chroococcidiopsis sp. TS-821]|uniref:response regulator n=1 Tax=Chroococcidiopsis sp. TS-821 TaxID=1378066 RepID=UPI000CEF0689|nr:response regulator [Chroococcidiopsis sp. TS-821]
MANRQQHPQIARIPVIILTVNNDDKLRPIAFELGVTAYMNKPYSAEEMLTKIASLLEE